MCWPSRSRLISSSRRCRRWRADGVGVDQESHGPLGLTRKRVVPVELGLLNDERNASATRAWWSRSLHVWRSAAWEAAPLVSEAAERNEPAERVRMHASYGETLS